MSAATTTHKIRWYIYTYDSAGRRHMIPRTHGIRGSWGYDVICSCGWESRTGGAIRTYMEREVWLHKILESDDEGGE